MPTFKTFSTADTVDTRACGPVPNTEERMACGDGVETTVDDSMISEESVRNGF